MGNANVIIFHRWAGRESESTECIFRASSWWPDKPLRFPSQRRWGSHFRTPSGPPSKHTVMLTRQSQWVPSFSFVTEYNVDRINFSVTASVKCMWDDVTDKSLNGSGRRYCCLLVSVIYKWIYPVSFLCFAAVWPIRGHSPQCNDPMAWVTSHIKFPRQTARGPL